MIALGSTVRLAPKARLRFDERSGDHVLLYPERGLILSASAVRIAELCRGDVAVAVAAIVDRLAAEMPDEGRARIEADVLAFLGALEERGLLVVGAGS